MIAPEGLREVSAHERHQPGGRGVELGLKGRDLILEIEALEGPRPVGLGPLSLGGAELQVLGRHGIKLDRDALIDQLQSIVEGSEPRFLRGSDELAEPLESSRSDFS